MQIKHVYYIKKVMSAKRRLFPPQQMLTAASAEWKPNF